MMPAPLPCTTNHQQNDTDVAVTLLLFIVAMLFEGEPGSVPRCHCTGQSATLWVEWWMLASEGAEDAMRPKQRGR